jgi:hypothetical protein
VVVVVVVVVVVAVAPAAKPACVVKELRIMYASLKFMRAAITKYKYISKGQQRKCY